MKILRFAYFNIRKHKSEAISLFILMLLCTTLLVASVTGSAGLNRLVDDAFDRTGSYHNYIPIPLKDYKDIYLKYILDDERVSRVVATDYIWESDAKYIDKSGEEGAILASFITLETHALQEDMLLESSLSLEEIEKKEHFILMPFYMQDSFGYEEGDTFNFLYNGKVYPFEVAGFYETGFFAYPSYAVQMIISDNDYGTLQRVMTRHKLLSFDMAEGENVEAFFEDFDHFAKDQAIGNETSGIGMMSYSSTKANAIMFIDIVMKIMMVMAVVVFAAVVFVIGYRIKNDIDEQMVSIGVMEALGYRSREIIGSYVLEYVLIAGVSAAIGLFASIFAAGGLFKVGEVLTGYHGTPANVGITGILLTLMLILFVALISFMSARRVNKYPPVIAFRKGIGNHSHKRNVLPLEKTRGSVHLRLAAKGFLENTGTNIGMGLCIGIAVIALVACFCVNAYFNNGITGLLPIMGYEVPDMTVEVMSGTEPEELRSEILAMPEVRKVNLTNSMGDISNGTVSFEGHNYLSGTIVSFQDFDETEHIRPTHGRFPKHDNECMIGEPLARMLSKEIGDTVTISHGKLQADYVICGTATAVMSEGKIVCMTDEAYRRIHPGFYLNNLGIYLNEGTDRQAFREKIYSLYGTPASQNEDAPLTEGTLAERIRDEADRKMAAMLEMYGVDSVDYTIQIGDEIISGSSSRFKLRSGLDVMELFESKLAGMFTAVAMGTGAFMVISVIVIMIIIFLIINSAVKKQRSELGILKGMGYSSGELMLQMAFRIVPSLVIAVITGTAIGCIGLDAIMKNVYGTLTFPIVELVFVDIFVCLFGFAVAYFSARKIKKISVYELMQE